MQFLKIHPDMQLKDLSNAVGAKNISNILQLNRLTRTPLIGKQLYDMQKRVKATAKDVSVLRKASILNTFTGHTDVFEAAALLGTSGWKVLAQTETFPGMLRIPDSMKLPDRFEMLGSAVPLPKVIYKKAIKQLDSPPHYIHPEIFGGVHTGKASGSIKRRSLEGGSEGLFEWAHIPWGEVTMSSSLDDSPIEFPVYPEEISDSVKANYIQMPELLYQYEPWQIYTSSGPRQQTFSFSFHRDMWTGDHRDGQANRLIRRCMSQCYPEFRGSSVHPAIVTLYLAGKPEIRGVLTDVSVNWDGPLGLDNWYLHCKLDLTIVEISPQALTHQSVASKPLIG